MTKKAKKVDISSKRIIGIAPSRWVEWVTKIANVTVKEIISSDFQWVSREGDVLVRVSTQEHGEFLVLNEMQLRYDAKMPRRMRAYAALAEEKYQKPVYPVLINILQPSQNTEIVNCYESEFLDVRAYQNYRVINLWEVEAQAVFQQPLPSLLPFVPILKDGGEEGTIRQALQLLREDEQLSELENLLAFFATFVLETEVVQQIMRWDMAVLQESPWYQQILQEGVKIGQQQGIEIGQQQGEQRGEKRGILSGIEIGLELKFGESGKEVFSEINTIENIQILEEILGSLKTVETIDQLRQIYLK
ncbi:MAG: Rpn family recombination-promoting nuclease/putative transposase [Okeania sp. SIO3B5]|uniref:transposase n=1 Tax=Okeania sp. SIO3B5 TaxID=2607811 RepID=UPI0013FF4EA0|nr:transposase [Okeania sp. SIO3B5]NEO54821.1 Rpn family recombination-promoting nuclease/putative transposase [Okeania sp. SIO3B5]